MNGHEWSKHLQNWGMISIATPPTMELINIQKVNLNNQQKKNIKQIISIDPPSPNIAH